MKRIKSLVFLASMTFAQLSYGSLCNLAIEGLDDSEKSLFQMNKKFEGKGYRLISFERSYNDADLIIDKNDLPSMNHEYKSCEVGLPSISPFRVGSGPMVCRGQDRTIYDKSIVYMRTSTGNIFKDIETPKKSITWNGEINTLNVFVLKTLLPRLPKVKCN